MLGQVRVSDVDPAKTKWKRLFNALAESQNRTRSGDRVLAFISHALEPARYQGNSATLEERRDRVNVVLLLYDGLEFREDGKFHKTKKASSLPEAQQRASRLRSALERRGVHPDVLHYCSAEFLGDNPFHAVLEATKSVAGSERKLSKVIRIARRRPRARPRRHLHLVTSRSWRCQRPPRVHRMPPPYGKPSPARPPGGAISRGRAASWIISELTGRRGALCGERTSGPARHRLGERH